MKRKIIVAVQIVLLVAVIYGLAQTRKRRPDAPSPAVAAKAVAPTAVVREIAGMRLNECSDPGVGVAFLCDFSWRDENDSPDVAYFIIRMEPEVKFKVAKIPVEISYIQELNRDSLEVIGGYAPGFAVDNTDIGEHLALKVKAFSAENPDIRRLDYYFVRNGRLFALLFSVNPKEEWNNYKFLFEEIVTSLKFLD